METRRGVGLAHFLHPSPKYRHKIRIERWGKFLYSLSYSVQFCIVKLSVFFSVWMLVFFLFLFFWGGAKWFAFHIRSNTKARGGGLFVILAMIVGIRYKKSPINHMNGQTEKTLFSRKDNLYFLFDYSEIFVDCILIVYLNALCCKKYNYEINEWRNRISIWWCSANSAIKMTCIHISRIVDIGKLENGCISITFFILIHRSQVIVSNLAGCFFLGGGGGGIWFFGVFF